MFICQILMNHTITIMARRAMYWLSSPLKKQSFGDSVTVRFENPELKRLKNGAITELKLVVKDENNNVVDNNGLSMSCVLEII